MRKGIIIFTAALIMILGSVSLFAQCGYGRGNGRYNHSNHHNKRENYNGCRYYSTYSNQFIK